MDSLRFERTEVAEETDVALVVSDTATATTAACPQPADSSLDQVAHRSEFKPSNSQASTLFSNYPLKVSAELLNLVKSLKGLNNRDLLQDKALRIQKLLESNHLSIFLCLNRIQYSRIFHCIVSIPVILANEVKGCDMNDFYIPRYAPVLNLIQYKSLYSKNS